MTKRDQLSDVMTFTDFRQKIETAKIDPDIRQACLVITDILSEIELGDGYQLGVPFFAQRAPSVPKNQLLPALNILCTIREPILSMHGYLLTENGQEHLSEEEFHSLIVTGELAHPETGEPISRPLEHVCIYYSIRDESRDES